MNHRPVAEVDAKDILTSFSLGNSLKKNAKIPHDASKLFINSVLKTKMILMKMHFRLEHDYTSEVKTKNVCTDMWLTPSLDD